MKFVLGRFCAWQMVFSTFVLAFVVMNISVSVGVAVLKRVFFERIIWTSNHCADWKYIFMLDKSGVDQGGSSRWRQLLAG